MAAVSHPGRKIPVARGGFGVSDLAVDIDLRSRRSCGGRLIAARLPRTLAPVVMPVMLMVSLPSVVNRDYPIRWKWLWQRAVAFAAIVHSHAFGSLPPEKVYRPEHRQDTQRNPAGQPKPTKVEFPHDHAEK